jgi:hypothetical protein
MSAIRVYRGRRRRTRSQRPNLPRPRLTDRRGTEDMPPLAVLGVNCFDAIPVAFPAFRVAVRLHFANRHAARRPIFLDVPAVDEAHALEAVCDKCSGGYITEVEVLACVSLRAVGSENQERAT